MSTHAAKECILFPDDVVDADEIRLTNAIIGERVACFVPD